ncbi:flagellar hook-length control protein FliK [Paracoccus shandongensis]|uniref:flagellar hook-length control protein FliK n=1 Tax=Paracoccus shandongensis TaxID=2816048 RepID=UPI001A90B98F
MSAAEPAEAEAEGSGADFTVEVALPEEGTEAAEPEAADVLAADPLQMLIEDLSGITGALREAPSPAPDKTAAESLLAGAASSPVLPAEARVEGAPVDPALTGMTAEEPRRSSPQGMADITALDMQAEGAVIDLNPADMSTEVEALLADPAAGPAPALSRDEAAVPAEMRLAKPAALPVARQIAEAVVTARDDVIEIALAPEELGKIRMVLTGPDHNPHVTVWVERPEVLDQLRRNAAFLQECLGDAGMADASFEFQGDTPSGSRKDHPAAASAVSSAFEGAEPVRSIPVAWTPMAIPARLDIRV